MPADRAAGQRGMAELDVLVVGSLNLDRTVRVAHFPEPGETVIARSASISAGGKGLNQAVAAARWGARVALAGAVGEDGSGSQLLALLDRERVRLDLIQRVAQQPTGEAFVIVDDQAENRIVVSGGANSALDAELVADAVRRSAATVVLLQCEVPFPVVAVAAEAARSVGSLVLLNPSPFPAEQDTALRRLPIDVLILNRGEADQLARPAGGLVPAGRVVVTEGPAGVSYTEPDGGTVRVAGHRVSALDTTGAGDVFAGTLAAGLARGTPLHEAMAESNAAAALAVTRAGAAEAAPTRAEVLAFRSATAG